MKIVPKFDRVLLKREGLEVKSSIIIPEAIAKANQSERGTVVAVGPTAGVWKDGVLIHGINAGERVIFARHAGIEIKEGESSFWLVQDTDIHASLEESI